MNKSNKVTIEFNHGYIIPIASVDEDVELYKRVENCEVILDGEDLHYIEISILAINLGFNSSKELFEKYPNDIKGYLVDGNSIEVISTVVHEK